PPLQHRAGRAPVHDPSHPRPRGRIRALPGREPRAHARRLAVSPRHALRDPPRLVRALPLAALGSEHHYRGGSMPKLVALTVRKLKPGSYDEWRDAWGSSDGPPGVKAYIARSMSDPNEILAFGMVEGEISELEKYRPTA